MRPFALLPAVAATVLVFVTPTAAATPARTCVPEGAIALQSAPPHHLYRFVRGPITACSGTGVPLELGGWADDTKPPLPWPRTTRVTALSGGCVALDEFQADAYGGSGAVTVVDLNAGTTWPLGAYAASQFSRVAFSAPSFDADCSATWTITETQAGSAASSRQASVAAPADAARVAAHPGVRPKVRSAPLLARDASARVAVSARLDRAPRAVTAVVGGTRVAIRTTARSVRLRLSRSDSRAFKAGRRYAVAVTACDDGCATATYRVTLR